MSSLSLGALIGAGGYGTVYHARWERRKVAIKKFGVSQAEASKAAALQQEIQVLETLRDRHIIQFYGTTYHEGMLVLVMDYAEGGSLTGAIESHKVTGWSTKNRIAQEIVRGLDYIHHKNIVHRDLKSANVLLTKHMEVKLCDFGLAMVKVKSASKSSNGANEALKGTLRWMAPELFAARPKYSTKSDIFALGMVMWEMAANCTMPFQEQSDNFVVMSLIKSGEREELPDDTPAEYRQWVQRCWDQDPAKRPEASDMVKEDEDENSAMVQMCFGGAGSTVSITEDLSLMSLSEPSSLGTNSTHGASRTLVGNTNNTSKKNSNTTATLVSSTLPVSMQDEQQEQQQQEATSQHDRHLSEEVRALMQLAESGDAQAQASLAEKYMQGADGLEKDTAKTRYWYEQAGKQGHLAAQCNLGFLFFFGHGGVQSDADAFLWFSRAAELGDAQSQHNVGWLYMHGRGTSSRDYYRAQQWYAKAADQGFRDSQNNLGWMYDLGVGVDQDDSTAFYWYEMSAQQGNPKAQFNVGSMYELGFGCSKDRDLAITWFQVAAENGEHDAELHLEWLHTPDGAGDIIPRSDENAFTIYTEAAIQGHIVAQFNLARFYEKGRDPSSGRRDLDSAKFWYREAAKQDHQSAAEILQCLEE